MTVNKWLVRLATFGPVGYFILPGTTATMISLPILCWVRAYIQHYWLQALFIIIMVGIANRAILHALRHLRRFDDPPEIVIDEFVGVFVAFWNIPLSASSLLIGFILFRFFDILKIGGVSYFERFTDGWGIILDDVMAGLICNLTLHLLF